MKKILTFLFVFFSAFVLVACTTSVKYNYYDMVGEKQEIRVKIDKSDELMMAEINDPDGLFQVSVDSVGKVLNSLKDMKLLTTEVSGQTVIYAYPFSVANYKIYEAKLKLDLTSSYVSRYEYIEEVYKLANDIVVHAYLYSLTDAEQLLKEDEKFIEKVQIFVKLVEEVKEIDSKNYEEGLPALENLRDQYYNIQKNRR